MKIMEIMIFMPVEHVKTLCKTCNIYYFPIGGTGNHEHHENIIFMRFGTCKNPVQYMQYLLLFDCWHWKSQKIMKI